MQRYAKRSKSQRYPSFRVDPLIQQSHAFIIGEHTAVSFRVAGFIVQEADVSTRVTPASVASLQTTLLQKRAEHRLQTVRFAMLHRGSVSLVDAIINLILQIRRYAVLINNAAHCSIVSNVTHKLILCLAGSVDSNDRTCSYSIVRVFFFFFL